MTLFTKIVASPVGVLKLVARDAGLIAVLWADDRPGRVRLGPLVADAAHPVLHQAEAELDAYFAGRRRRFDVALDMVGTDFQKKVWAALLTIPFGEVRSYGALAAQIGMAPAARAVGAANGRNPLSIIVPCHRAIGTDGRLTGFAGGLDVKAQLLEFESGQGRFAA